MLNLSRIKHALYKNPSELKGNIFKVSSRNIPQAVPHPFLIKSKKILEKNTELVNRINISNQYEVLSDVITPHWKIPYEEELEIKQKMCEDVLEHIFNKLSRRKEDVEQVLQRIIASPVRDAYRTKDEFNIWKGIDDNPKTVGFYIGTPAVGKVVCVPPTHLKCIRESHKQIAQLYQDFIRSSPLPVSYQLFDGGFWRQIIVRSNSAGDHQALVVTHPAGFTAEQITEQQDILKNYFSQNVPSVSLFHQSCQHVKCTREMAPIRHLSGQPHITETMSGRTFQISPDSFFQANVLAAEIMYGVALKLAKLKHFTTLLDLYCGTGAVSLLASDFTRGCVGIEQVTSSIEDAKHNAELNSVTNCKFVAGQVERKLAEVLANLKHSSDIVAVVNPGRAGAGEGVISLLRRNSQVRRVIYISCKPDNLLTMKNFVQLCEKVGSGSKPFHLRTAVPVDLFPYTSHCELILCFEKT